MQKKKKKDNPPSYWLKLFQRKEKEEEFPNSFYEPSMSLIPKLDSEQVKLWTNPAYEYLQKPK